MTLILKASTAELTERIQAMLEEFFGKPLSKGVKPEEAVAFGAAIQVGVVSGSSVSYWGFFLHVLNPLTLGFETTGGIM